MTEKECKELDAEKIWKDDYFERRNFGESLYELIEKETRPLTIALDAKWGAGKTFFLERWRQDLLLKNACVIRYNAWEDDFLDDPLTSLVGQLAVQIESSFFEDLKKSFKTLKSALSKRLQQFCFYWLSVNTFGVITTNPEDYKSVDEKILDKYQGGLLAKEKFRKCLTLLSKRCVRETGKPLIFIVDELDRCRPLYSIKFLEHVKHFFGVENIVFVFGVDLQNLKKSIAAVYGSIAVNDYVRRFFDYEFSLPEIRAEQYCSKLLPLHGVENCIFRNNNQQGTEVTEIASPQRLEHYGYSVAKYLLDQNGTSLRQLEYFMRLLQFAFKNKEAETELPYFCYDALFILAALKVVNPILYYDLKSKRKELSALVEYLNPYFNEYSMHKYDEYSIFKDVIYTDLFLLQLASYRESAKDLIEELQSDSLHRMESINIFISKLPRDKETQIIDSVIEKLHDFRYRIELSWIFARLEIAP